VGRVVVGDVGFVVGVAIVLDVFPGGTERLVDATVVELG
jgi:hypothetical protein